MSCVLKLAFNKFFISVLYIFIIIESFKTITYKIQMEFYIILLSCTSCIDVTRLQTLNYQKINLISRFINAV